MVTQVAPNLYCISVPLPGNPLKNLNAYLIQGQRNLLVDTGFRQEECRTALLAGLAALKVDMARTDIFLTHLHSDHAGLAPELLTPTSRIFIGETDRKGLPSPMNDIGEGWRKFDQLMIPNGFPPELLQELTGTNPARTLAPIPCDRYEGVRDGDTFDYGGYCFQALDTPGHTPGHMVLWEPAYGILLLGDHVLFDITPNITIWPSYRNPLGGYLRSLERVRSLPVVLPLPGHRRVQKSFTERVDEIISHHRRRCGEALTVLRSTPGLTPYDLTARMTWQIRCRGWEDFPVPQKWFAVGEAMAHLEYLMDLGQVQRAWDGSYWRYHAARGEKG